MINFLTHIRKNNDNLASEPQIDIYRRDHTHSDSSD